MQSASGFSAPARWKRRWANRVSRSRTVCPGLRGSLGADPVPHQPVFAHYSFLRYANKAARSSGLGARSKFTPSVEETGGTTPSGAVACTRLKNSM